LIQSCPACHTLYRTAAADAGEPTFGRCSHCDETFPLRAARRSYALLGTGAVRGMTRLSIGMDDPALAPALEAAQARSEASALPFALEAPALDRAEAALFGLDTGTAPSDAAPTDEVATAEPAAAARPSPLRLLLAALLPALLGTVAGYHVSGLLQSDPVTGSGIGLAVGLAAGWAMMRWAAREN